METETEERILWTVPVANIIALSNPMEDDVWGCGIIEEEDVLACEDNRMGRYSSGRTPDDPASIEYNIARISWLMENYDWNNVEDEEPIQIELMEDCHWHVIVDGNHRVAAALILGLEHITVEISGEVDYCENILRPIAEVKI